MAFNLATTHYQIDPLLDAEDVNTNKPDKKSILMYVMCLYHAIDSIQSQLSSVGSIQMLDQHFDAVGGSCEEIQLLNERETEKPHQSKSDDEIDADSVQVRRVADLSDLDEISLAKSIDDLSNFPVPMSIKRSSTFTIKNKNDLAINTAVAFDQNETVDSMGATGSVDGPSASFQAFVESHSRPVSIATNASLELGSYQNAIECVLTLLLEAEETLAKQLPEINDLSAAKSQFQAHEDFMIKLSEYQEYVGSALEEGARLLQEPPSTSGLLAEDQSEIKQQMLLLNERWETLRMSALDVQSRVHARLADIQLRRIEELRILLTQTEDRISRMAELDPRLDAWQQQMDAHKALETSLNEQKVLVDDLSNLVVIINDDSFNDMEDKLTALGERWTHVVKWTKNRFERLKQIRDQWKLVNRRYAIVQDWLDARECDLKRMEANAITQIGSVMERMRNLRFCAVDLSLLYDCLLYLEEMAQPLKPASDELLEKVECLEDRCEALKEIVEVQQQRIESMGFNFEVDVKSAATLPTGWNDFHQRITRKSSTNESDSDESDAESPHSTKKRRVQKSPEHQQLEHTVDEMVTFVAAGERTLAELKSIGTPKEQREALEQLQKALNRKIDEYANAKKLLNGCVSNESAVDFDPLRQQISEVASKYDELNIRLEHLLGENERTEKRDKFQRNLTGLKLVLADCQDWYKQNATMTLANEEDLQNRLQYMDSLNSEIDDARTFCREMNENEPHEWLTDFEMFYESWSDIKRAIQRLLQEKFGVAVTETNPNQEVAEALCDEVEMAKVSVADAETMNNNLSRLNEIKQRIEEFRRSNDSDEAVEQVQRAANVLDECIIKQTTALDNLDHFIGEFETVTQSLRKLNDLLATDQFVPGEMDDLRRQHELYEAHGKEIKKIEIDIISVRNFSEIIARDANIECTEHSRDLAAQVTTLNELFARTVDLYKTNDQRLKQALTQSEEILARIAETEAWLGDLEANTPKTKNSEIKNSNELFQLRTKFQSMKEACEQKTILFRELNESGSEMLLQIDEMLNRPQSERKYSSLAKQFTKLNARWNEVTTLVYNRCGLLEHISNQLGELKTLLVSEAGYMDKLEKCLRRSPENAADAEEIYEELDVSDVNRMRFRCQIFNFFFAFLGSRKQHQKSFRRTIR